MFGGDVARVHDVPPSLVRNTRPPLATNPIIFGFVFATPMLRR
jgi:hypothetical protein